MQHYKYNSVLTIAGSDSGGGAGIQADLKTFAALGCYGTSVITAVTAQNTLGITAIHPIPPEIISSQIIAVMDDIKPSAIKIGMLPNQEAINVVAETLKIYNEVPIIIDPVMKSTSGTDLSGNESLQALTTQLFPLATLITPNINEAVLLTGNQISNIDDMHAAAMALLKYGNKAVLVKGGHLKGKMLYNVYADQAHTKETFSSPYIPSLNTHGTGCTLASAIAAYIASGQSLAGAIAAAGNYVNMAIKQGRYIKTGQGHGPLNHSFKPKKLTRKPD